MNSKQKFFIELLTTTVNSAGFLGRSIPQNVFITYLKLNDKHKEVEKDLREKYDRTTKKHFDDKINLSAYIEHVNSKIESFERLLSKTSSVDEYDLPPNESLRTKFKAVYDFYCSKTGQKRSKPLTINKYDKATVSSFGEKIEQIACDLLEVELLTEIQDKLQFSEVYSSSDIKIVKSVADACWEIYKSDNNISSESLADRVCLEYHIRNYNEDSAKETERKTKESAKQWYRDNKEKLQLK